MLRHHSSLRPRLQVQERPTRVFGQGVSHFRKPELQTILGFYNHPINKRTYSKVRLLELAASLQRELPDEEIARVTRFIHNVGSLGGVTRLEVLGAAGQGVKAEVKEEDQKLAVKKERQDCEVCLENVAGKKFPATKITATCEHEPTVCLECLRQHLHSRIETQELEIQCPLCPEQFQQLDIRSLVSEDDFNRYLDLEQRAFTSEREYITCLRPGCGNIQLHEDRDDYNIVTCSKCAFQMCFTHQCAFHHEMTCAQYDEALRKERNGQIEASNKMIKNTCKCCPGEGCGVPIELRSGCNHMTCWKCKHEFCYLCLASWREIDSAHTPDCPHHTANLDYGDENIPPEESSDEESENSGKE